jgi:uncharacterized spore protein YtfJ
MPKPASLRPASEISSLKIPIDKVTLGILAGRAKGTENSKTKNQLGTAAQNGPPDQPVRL